MADPEPTTPQGDAEAPAAPSGDPRPRPAYGEYAPEGWEWKPPTADSPASADSVSGSASGGTPPTLPGVPHNLGAGSALPSRTARAPQQSGGEPYRAAPPAQPGSTPASPVPPPMPNAQNPNTQVPGQAPLAPPPISPARREVETKVVRPADRIVTILLLIAGALGTVQLAFGLISLGRTFALIGAGSELESFTVPDWVSSMGQVTGLAILAFYAVTLVYSIRRLRTGKLTFWVPLAAGAIAVVVFIAVIAIAMFGIPELMSILADPEAAARLMERVQDLQGF